ncbi:TMEM175 family protein [Leifsonia shinshuensis]|uniref:TMEM175 family protein n=1 Tax=Leifsonia TaxID=110932 RepID=UPI002862BCAC|nr:TMEM175 family protein [Leifsonia shinshuensis]MDR6972238.1 putative membrane protein [Leifsonia shinshuensis]
MAVIRTERGLDRLVNFSDATVAIAITILILPLVDEASQIGHASFGAFIGENFWEIFAFVVSFAVIARFWVVHHRIFETVRDYNAAIVWFNFLWLLAIVVIPFSANVISASGGQRPEVYALYIGNMLLATLATRLIGTVLVRNPDLMTEEARADIDRTRGLAELLLMAAALVLAVLIPAINLWWLFLLFLAGPLHALLHRLAYGPSQKAA